MPAHALGAPAGRLDPEGAWNCLVYARFEFANDHLKLRLTADGRVVQARGESGPWARLSDWRERRGRIRFRDARTGRNYVGNLGYPTLGGTWTSPSSAGGWWCAKEPAELAAGSRSLRRSASDILAAPLVPTVTATPRYPRQAIREAKEGRAVACFLVDSEGAVTEPKLIEVSDEIFRKPALDALARSRYRGWRNAALFRPGCRTYIFTLDAVR